MDGLLLIEVCSVLWSAFWEAFSLIPMMETLDGSPDSRVDHGPARFQRRRKAKAYKTIEGKLRYVVGRDIYMDRVEALSHHALIGRLEYVSMEKKD